MLIDAVAALGVLLVMGEEKTAGCLTFLHGVKEGGGA